MQYAVESGAFYRGFRSSPLTAQVLQLPSHIPLQLPLPLQLQLQFTHQLVTLVS